MYDIFFTVRGYNYSLAQEGVWVGRGYSVYLTSMVAMYLYIDLEVLSLAINSLTLDAGDLGEGYLNSEPNVLNEITVPNLLLEFNETT